MMIEPVIICDTPSIIIPKELFREEKIHEYWNSLCSSSKQEEFGKDELENYIILYPRQKKEDSIHETTNLFHIIREKFPEQTEAVCINVYEDTFCLLVIKNREITYSGYFQYTVKEDVLYHVANISQHFFENNHRINYYYQHLSPAILRLLNTCFEIKKL